MTEGFSGRGRTVDEVELRQSFAVTNIIWTHVKTRLALTIPNKLHLYNAVLENQLTFIRDRMIIASHPLKVSFTRTLLRLPGLGRTVAASLPLGQILERPLPARDVSGFGRRR